jgi:hypothetical protein
VNQIRELFPAVTRIGVLREERVEVIKNA